MEIKICKWKDDKSAPVMLMVDDFANKYMIPAKMGSDWGGRCEEANSFYDLFCKPMLQKYPYLKLTLFLVVGPREPIVNNGKKYYSQEISDNNEFKEFLRKLSHHPNFELAYHGYTHGLCTEKGFIQEWCTFSDLTEAMERIKMAKSVYKEVSGIDFSGGKYCGYLSNDFSDDSILNTGFRWWCRYYDGVLFKGAEDKRLSFDVKTFGHVVDIPSTIEGNLFSLRSFRTYFHPREFLKALYQKIKYGITIEKKLDTLVENGHVISIQEHTSPEREDKKKQYPNVITDKDNLMYIFNYLQKYNLWYATGDEIARYYLASTSVKIDSKRDEFTLHCTNSDVIGNDITISVADHERFCLVDDDGRMINSIVNDKNIFTIQLRKNSNHFKLRKG